MCSIKIINVSKKIKKHFVLHDINLHIISNQVYGFVGRNGSGKTMLFRAICGLISTTGIIEMNGEVIGKDISFPSDMGLVLENIGLYPEYSGFENLKMLASICKKIDDKQIKTAILRVGLDPSDKRPIRKYSLGMKQRILLAQAIMENPKLLILDEPTNALDINGVDMIRTIIKEEKENGATILISSHNTQDIEQLCDVVVTMGNGGIIEVKNI
jgi:ABC-2 type transport system ATP-binding protein